MPREIEVVPDWRDSGRWGDLILVGRDRFGRPSAEALAHELAHIKLKEKEVEPWDDTYQFYRELQAWAYALQDAPKGEWNRDIVKDSLQHYLDRVIEGDYSREEVEDARAAMRELFKRYRKKFRR